MSSNHDDSGWRKVLDEVCRASEFPADERLRALGSPGERRAEDVVRVDAERHWALFEDACRRARQAETLKAEVLERCWRLDRKAEGHYETERSLRNEINNYRHLYEAANQRIENLSTERVHALCDRIAKSENALRRVRDFIRDKMDVVGFRDDVPEDVKSALRELADMAAVLGGEE